MTESRSPFEELMQRVRDGCPEATKQLVSEYGPHILSVVRRRLHQRLRARFDSFDFVQDVWASFFTSPPPRQEFAQPEDLIAYLVKMARNKVVNEFRQNVQTQKRNLNREHSLDGSAAHEAACLIGPDPTPSQVFLAEERWQELLAAQPKHYQQILDLRRQGMSPSDIAKAVGMNERTVRRVLAKFAPETPP